MSSLDSAFFYKNEHVAKNAVVSQLSSYLSCDTDFFIIGIKFFSDILTYCVINNVEQQCRYKLVQWNNKGPFNIFSHISDHVTLVQMEYLSGNVNRAVSIAESWIYGSNHKIPLPLMR